MSGDGSCELKLGFRKEPSPLWCAAESLTVLLLDHDYQPLGLKPDFKQPCPKRNGCSKSRGPPVGSACRDFLSNDPQSAYAVLNSGLKLRKDGNEFRLSLCGNCLRP